MKKLLILAALAAGAFFAYSKYSGQKPADVWSQATDKLS